MILVMMAVLGFARGGFSFNAQWILNRLLMLPGIIIGLSFHEYAHGIVSYKLGDPTPKVQGRLTLNPIAHIDPIGFVMLIVVGFGWGIPVQIDPRFYKHRRRDEALVAVAGVTMNLIIAIVLTVILKLIMMTAGNIIYTDAGSIAISMIQYGVLINIILMIFNLLPVPPLDGFNLITQVFNLDRFEWTKTIRRYGYMILLFLVMFNVTGLIIRPIIDWVYLMLMNFIA